MDRRADPLLPRSTSRSGKLLADACRARCRLSRASDNSRIPLYPSARPFSIDLETSRAFLNCLSYQKHDGKMINKQSEVCCSPISRGCNKPTSILTLDLAGYDAHVCVYIYFVGLFLRIDDNFCFLFFATRATPLFLFSK